MATFSAVVGRPVNVTEDSPSNLLFNASGLSVRRNPAGDRLPAGLSVSVALTRGACQQAGEADLFRNPYGNRQ